MSHMVTLPLSFGREDILIEALAKFNKTLTHGKTARYYGKQQKKVDRVVKLRSYDLGFIFKDIEHKALNDSEVDTDSSVKVLVPTYDKWDGSVETIFGKNLCKLSAAYYSEMVQQSAMETGQSLHVVEETETKDTLTVTLSA